MSEKLTLMLSPTKLNVAEQCTRKYGLSYGGLFEGEVKGRIPKKKSEALEKGDLTHKMLEVHYRGKKEGKPYDQIIAEAIAYGRLAYIDMGLPIADAEEVIKVYNQYAIFYRFETWMPLEIEQAFSYILYEDDELRIQVQGKTDLVTEQFGSNCPIDHKTGSRNSKARLTSNQFAMSAIAWGASNVIINRVGFQKSLKPEEKFVRQTLSYPNSWLEDWKEWTIYKAKMLHAHITANIYPPNFASCHNFGGCSYLKVCESTPDARLWKYREEYEEVEPFNLWKTEVENED